MLCIFCRVLGPRPANFKTSTPRGHPAGADVPRTPPIRSVHGPLPFYYDLQPKNNNKPSQGLLHSCSRYDGSLSSLYRVARSPQSLATRSHVHSAAVVRRSSSRSPPLVVFVGSYQVRSRRLSRVACVFGVDRNIIILSTLRWLPAKYWCTEEKERWDRRAYRSFRPNNM